MGMEGMTIAGVFCILGRVTRPYRGQVLGGWIPNSAQEQPSPSTRLSPGLDLDL